MAQAITRLFDTHNEALSAIRDLEAAGIDHARISLIANNADKWHDGDRRGDDNDTAEGAAKGATTGGLIGGAGGLLAGLGMLAIPGLGPVVAAGWLVSTAAGAIAGAVAGGAAGGVLGALKDAGHSDDDAQVYAEGVRRGGSLVSVKAQDSGEAARAEQILMTHGGVDAERRGQDYRQTGWARFDENAAPYDPTQIAAERDRYREPRSFQGAGSDSIDYGTDGRATGVGADLRPSGPTVRDL
ncbi:hypothetical protein [Phenylobacterium hankyongense]|uniref:hypothetical protein n=1 Tax=Phenylobacterium hankyongense TaxID=1813876 RepID=UPI001A9EC0C3|nr:hypothetical protein [Phenylobacterium hankyongense]